MNLSVLQWNNKFKKIIWNSHELWLLILNNLKLIPGICPISNDVQRWNICGNDLIVEQTEKNQKNQIYRLTESFYFIHCLDSRGQFAFLYHAHIVHKIYLNFVFKWLRINLQIVYIFKDCRHYLQKKKL